MSYNILVTSNFKKQLKRLAKKYPSLNTEFGELIKSLKQNPELGTPIGNHCFKVRIKIASKGKGKSGGGRVITHVHIINEIVYLLTVYDKSELENISDKDLEILLKNL